MLCMGWWGQRWCTWWSLTQPGSPSTCGCLSRDGWLWNIILWMVPANSLIISLHPISSLRKHDAEKIENIYEKKCMLKIPDGWHNHENIPNDTNDSNNDIAEAEQYLNIFIENQILIGIAGSIHHFIRIYLSSKLVCLYFGFHLYRVLYNCEWRTLDRAAHIYREGDPQTASCRGTIFLVDILSSWWHFDNFKHCIYIA